jgi:hypothetical protein
MIIKFSLFFLAVAFSFKRFPKFLCLNFLAHSLYATKIKTTKNNEEKNGEKKY